MIKIGSFEFPTRCPNDCELQDNISQGGLCHRCPVFNCSSIDEDDEPLLAPEEYRLDWAQQWDQFFKTGQRPQLKF